MATHAYGIERRYDDQAPDFVVETAPWVLAALARVLCARLDPKMAAMSGRVFGMAA